MVDITDVQGYTDKFENQLSLLENADIPENDRTAILELVHHEDAQDTIEVGTIVNHINRLRLSSERADVPLTDMAKTDVDSFLFSLKHDRELAEGTLRNYRKALRKFFKHHDREWAEDVEIGASPDRSVDPSQLLDMDEIMALIEAANNPRDKAFVAVLADTGLRIGAACSLRVQDVAFDGPAGTITINEDGPVKGASGQKPVTWSRGYLGNWLDVHPRNDEPGAPLFHKTKHLTDGEDGALTYQYAARRLKWVAEEADIDTDRVNAHNFRKSAISRWIREGLSEQAIKHRAGWVKDSTQFDVYSAVTDEEMNEDILDHYGLAESESASPELDACPACRTPLSDEARFCPGCGSPLSQAAAEAAEESETAVFEGKSVPASGTDVDGALGEMLRVLKGDDEARAAAVEFLGGG